MNPPTKLAEIAAASEEQAAQTSQVLISIENISAATEESAASRKKVMSRMNVKNRLIIAFLAILLLPCAGIGWFSYQTAKTQINNKMLSSARQSAETVNNQISDLIGSATSDMDYLAKQINSGMAEGFESPKIRQTLDQYKSLHPGFELVYFGNQDGLMLRSPEKKVEGFDPRTRDWYINAMSAKGKATVNPPSISSSTGHITWAK